MRDLLDHLGVAASGTAGFSFSFSFFGAAGTVALAGTALPVTLNGAAGRHLTPKKPSSHVSLAEHCPRQGSASQRPARFAADAPSASGVITAAPMSEFVDAWQDRTPAARRTAKERMQTV